MGNPQCLVNSLKFPVSSSLNPNFYMSQVPCLPLSGRKLNHIIKNAGQAAADAKAANLDGVYLHGHEGYLLEQMTNPAFNRRALGHFSNWQAFGLDMVREIRRRVGDAYPIMYRIDLSLALNETYGEAIHGTSMKKFVNGRTVDMTLEYMKNLVAAGVDIFDVDLGCYDNWWLPHPPGSHASRLFPGGGPHRQGVLFRQPDPLQRRGGGAGGGRGQAGLSRSGGGGRCGAACATW